MMGEWKKNKRNGFEIFGSHMGRRIQYFRSIIMRKMIKLQKLILNDIFDGCTENYQPKEFDRGNPVGKEV